MTDIYIFTATETIKQDWFIYDVPEKRIALFVKANSEEAALEEGASIIEVDGLNAFNFVGRRNGDTVEIYTNENFSSDDLVIVYSDMKAVKVDADWDPVPEKYIRVYEGHIDTNGATAAKQPNTTLSSGIDWCFQELEKMTDEKQDESHAWIYVYDFPVDYSGDSTNEKLYAWQADGNKPVYSVNMY